MLKANHQLMQILKSHVILLQAGKFGTPDISDLNLAADIHKMIETHDIQPESKDNITQ